MKKESEISDAVMASDCNIGNSHFPEEIPLRHFIAVGLFYGISHMLCSNTILYHATRADQRVLPWYN